MPQNPEEVVIDKNSITNSGMSEEDIYKELEESDELGDAAYTNPGFSFGDDMLGDELPPDDSYFIEPDDVKGRPDPRDVPEDSEETLAALAFISVKGDVMSDENDRQIAGDEIIDEAQEPVFDMEMNNPLADYSGVSGFIAGSDSVNPETFEEGDVEQSAYNGPSSVGYEVGNGTGSSEESGMGFGNENSDAQNSGQPAVVPDESVGLDASAVGAGSGVSDAGSVSQSVSSLSGFSSASGNNEEDRLGQVAGQAIDGSASSGGNETGNGTVSGEVGQAGQAVGQATNDSFSGGDKTGNFSGDVDTTAVAGGDSPDVVKNLATGVSNDSSGLSVVNNGDEKNKFSLQNVSSGTNINNDVSDVQQTQVSNQVMSPSGVKPGVLKNFTKAAGVYSQELNRPGVQKSKDQDFAYRLQRKNQVVLENTDVLNKDILASVELIREMNLSVVDTLAKFNAVDQKMRTVIKEGNDVSLRMDQLITKSNNMFTDKYMDNIQKTCERNLSSYIESSRSNYVELFKIAVRDYRNFSDAAMKFQRNMEAKFSNEFRTLVKIIYLLPFLLIINIVLLAVIIWRLV